MSELHHLGEPGENVPHDAPVETSLNELSLLERIIPRVLRNILLASVLLLAPVFWYYRSAGSIGFAFGAAVSYVNFRSLTRGVEGLADRIVNRNSHEKGGRILLRFMVRYGLVGAVAYAIFIGFFAGVSRLSMGLVCARCGPDGGGGMGRIRRFPAHAVNRVSRLSVLSSRAGRGIWSLSIPSEARDLQFEITEFEIND